MRPSPQHLLELSRLLGGPAREHDELANVGKVLQLARRGRLDVQHKSSEKRQRLLIPVPIPRRLFAHRYHHVSDDLRGDGFERPATENDRHISRRTRDRLQRSSSRSRPVPARLRRDSIVATLGRFRSKLAEPSQAFFSS